jgi:hypothetical protein
MTAMVTAAIENNNNGGSVGGGGSRRATEAADGHCHEAARAEADLSVLDIPPTIRVLSQIALLRRSTGRRFEVSTEENLGREDSTCSDQ